MIARNNLEECCFPSQEEVLPDDLMTVDNLTVPVDVFGVCHTRPHPLPAEGVSQSSGSAMSVAEAEAEAPVRTSKHPPAVVVMDADVTDAGTAAKNAGQAPADIVSTGPGTALVNQLLQIPGENGQEWSSRLGSLIPRKSWESL